MTAKQQKAPFMESENPGKLNFSVIPIEKNPNPEVAKLRLRPVSISGYVAEFGMRLQRQSETATAAIANNSPKLINTAIMKCTCFPEGATCLATGSFFRTSSDNACKSVGEN